MSCMFVKLQLREQGTNLYGDAGEFDRCCDINVEIWNSLYCKTADDTVEANLNYSVLKDREKYAKALNQTQL